MQVRRHQPDYILYFTVVILCAIGVITVYSASTPMALHQNPPLPASYFAARQLIAAGIGLLFFTLFSFLPYQFWYRYAVPLFGFSFFLLFLVLIPGIGKKVSGGRRWIGSTTYHIQPSEIAIIAIVIYLAYFFTRKITVLHNFKQGLRPALITVFAVSALILAEPDMGTAMTLVATAATILVASGTPMRRLLAIIGISLPFIVLVAISASYRIQRLTSFLGNHPPYQLVQSLTAISAGGWFGRGFDLSIEKTGYLPVPQADFIFPVVVEEWGFVGAITLIVIFGVLIWRGFWVARHASDRFGALLAVGLTGMITMKTLINLGAVTGLMPITGIPLPFISYGGTSLIVNLAAAGLIVSVSRRTLIEEPDADQLAEIVDVQHARERVKTRETRPVVSPRSREQASARSKVTPLPAASQRRAERETVGKAREVDRRSRKQPASSWRDRSEQLNSWRQMEPSSKKPSDRRGNFRREP